MHSYIIIIFILDIINDNNYCIDDKKENSTENATTIIINSYNEGEEKQSTSNGKYFKSIKLFIFLNLKIMCLLVLKSCQVMMKK